MLSAVSSGVHEFCWRLTAASPTQRYLRVMPAVCCLSTLFFVLLALENRLDWGSSRVWNDWVNLLLPVYHWGNLIGKARRVRASQKIGCVFMPWSLEWAAGLFSTLLVVSFGYFVLTPHVHHHHVLTTRLILCGLIGAAAIIGLAICTLYWWVRVVSELCRPSSNV